MGKRKNGKTGKGRGKPLPKKQKPIKREIKAVEKEAKEVEKVEKVMARKGPPVNEAKAMEVPHVPRIRKINDNRMVIAHTEFLSEIPGPNSFSCLAFNLNPGDTKTFPRGSQEARNFYFYKVRKLNAKFTTSCPTTTSGVLYMAFSPDAYGSPPASAQEMLNLEPSKSWPIWTEEAREYNLTVSLDKQKSYYIPQDNAPPSSDVEALFSAGFLYVATSGTLDESGNVKPLVGLLELEYVFEVDTPKLTPDSSYTQGLQAFANQNSTKVNEDNPLGQPGYLKCLPGIFDCHTIGVNEVTRGLTFDDPNYGIFGYLFHISQNVNMMVTANILGGAFNTTGSNPIMWWNGNAINPSYVIDNSPGVGTDKLTMQTLLPFYSTRTSGIQAGNSLGIGSQWYGFQMIGFQCVSTAAPTYSNLCMYPSSAVWNDQWQIPSPSTFNDNSSLDFQLFACNPNSASGRAAYARYMNSKHAAKIKMAPEPDPSPFLLKYDIQPAGLTSISGLAPASNRPKKKIEPSMYYTGDGRRKLAKGIYRDGTDIMVSCDGTFDPKDKDAGFGKFDNLFIPINIGGNQSNIQNFCNHGFEQPLSHVLKCKDCLNQAVPKLKETQTYLLGKSQKNSNDLDIIKTIESIMGTITTLGGLFG